MLGSVTDRVRSTGKESPVRSTTGADDRGAVQVAYDRLVRPHLPYKLSVHNGVPARGAKLLDFTDRFPEYEAAIVDSLRERVSDGDDVVVVGGGLGISSVVAARHAGASGSVTTYEAGADQYDRVVDSLEINDVADRVTVEHAIVGTAVSTYTPPEDARVLDPVDLPACDVLEMDCEGAELDILKDLAVRPRVLVVETHANLGAAEDDVRAELERLGYDIVERVEENSSKGIAVLTAVRDDD